MSSTPGLPFGAPPASVGDYDHPAPGDEWVKTVRDRPDYRRFLRFDLRRVVYEDWVTRPGVEQSISRRAWRTWAKDAAYRGNTPVVRQ